MKTSKLFKLFALTLFVGILSISCKGPEGPQGTPGVNGVDGVDGTDGNANVQTYIFNNPEWNGRYWMDLDMSGIITQDVVTNDVILGYVKPLTSLVNPIPGRISSSPASNIKVNIFESGNLEGTYRIVCYKLDGSEMPTDDLPTLIWAKVIIIESTNTTTKNTAGKMISPKQRVLNELKAAGVDINNYYDVCAYYGINPE